VLRERWSFRTAKTEGDIRNAKLLLCNLIPEPYFTGGKSLL
jgi:hypothetical protein